MTSVIAGQVLAPYRFRPQLELKVLVQPGKLQFLRPPFPSALRDEGSSPSLGPSSGFAASPFGWGLGLLKGCR